MWLGNPVARLIYLNTHNSMLIVYLDNIKAENQYLSCLWYDAYRLFILFEKK